MLTVSYAKLKKIYEKVQICMRICQRYDVFSVKWLVHLQFTPMVFMKHLKCEEWILSGVSLLDLGSFL